MEITIKINGRMTPVEAGIWRGGTSLPESFHQSGQEVRCPAVPIRLKAVCGSLPCDDSASDNDTPVLQRRAADRDPAGGESPVER